MAGKTGEVGRLLVDRVIVRGVGSLALLGAMIFLFMGIHAIAIYLFLAGAAFWISSLNWQRRYDNVLESPPAGFRPTGEVYINPGSDSAVAVYFKGIRRVYVKSDVQVSL